MNRFVLHPEVYHDLDEIWEYIAEDNLNAADRVINEIYSVVGSVTSFPRQGHKRPDLTSRPMRFQVAREYLIAYAPDSKPLLVVAVLHGRRDPHAIKAILEQRQ